MKTIEKGLEEAYIKAGENAYFGNGFKAGVEFAERWIPVEENQYPDLDLSDKFNKRQGYSETVLVKEQGRIYFGFYAKYIDSWIVSGRSGNIHVTHWRPINHR